MWLTGLDGSAIKEWEKESNLSLHDDDETGQEEWLNYFIDYSTILDN